MILDRADVHTGENGERVRAAMARFTLEEARTPAAFEEGYAQLLGAFGPTGEIERRETLEAWFTGALMPTKGPIRASYHLLLARDTDGRIAAVRDCFVTVDAAAARSVVLLSHTLVLPAYRRTGLSSLMRAAPVTLARRALAEAGLAAAEILLMAEMEMVTPADRDSVVRLLAYARGGFQVVLPRALPYAQPDFRDLAALGVPPEPLPFLVVIRQVGEEERSSVSVARAAAIVRHVQTIHGCHCSAADLAPIRDHALAALAAFGQDPVPLLRLPADRAQIAALAPLLRSVVFPLYPVAWQGKDPLADPDRELAELIAAWPPSAEEPR